ncbi:MAG: hypothetical protein LBU25_11060 [Treponema sp.]|nr:hypothetical protein [Treponema sp.]
MLIRKQFEWLPFIYLSSDNPGDFALDSYRLLFVDDLARPSSICFLSAAASAGYETV